MANQGIETDFFSVNIKVNDNEEFSEKVVAQIKEGVRKILRETIKETGFYLLAFNTGNWDFSFQVPFKVKEALEQKLSDKVNGKSKLPIAFEVRGKEPAEAVGY